MVQPHNTSMVNATLWAQQKSGKYLIWQTNTQINWILLYFCELQMHLSALKWCCLCLPHQMLANRKGWVVRILINPPCVSHFTRGNHVKLASTWNARHADLYFNVNNFHINAQCWAFPMAAFAHPFFFNTIIVPHQEKKNVYLAILWQAAAATLSQCWLTVEFVRFPHGLTLK